LAVNFLYKEPSAYISVERAEIPLPTHGEQPKLENWLSLDMLLWDITRGHSAYSSASCDPCHNPSSISEVGMCGCFVHFHGRHFPIKDWGVKICFEFPNIVGGSMEQRRYRCVDTNAFMVAGILNGHGPQRVRIILKQSGPSPYFRGPYELYHTFTVLPPTQATPPIPAHVWRLLSVHALTEAIFMPGSLPGPFDHTLARGLGLDRHCLPLLSALSSHKYRQMTYRLSITKRQLILDIFHRDLKTHRTSVNGNSRKLECLQGQYNIAQLITTLQSPICYLPVELLDYIFSIAVERLGVNPTTLEGVSRTWRTGAARLWGVLHVCTWTETQPIKAVVERNPSSMTVVIDTAMDEALSVPSQEPYAALAFAWTSASRWRSLTINSFPSKASILGSNKAALVPRVPLENLQSLSMGIGCDSSQYVKELMEAIASSSTPKLTSLTLAAAAVLQHLNQSQWVHIYSRLTVLEVDIIKFEEPVDLLRHCACLKVLKLSGVVSHRLFSQEELPLLQTLRQLWLQRASIQWMVGRTFERLESCTLLSPVDIHVIDQANVIGLPVCSSILLRSHAVRILAIADAPAVDTIKIECNQWSKPRANLELRSIWSQIREPRMLQPRVLSLKIICGDQPLLEALQHMVLLRELILDLPHPSALGVNFFEAMCAVPTIAFTGKTREEWTRWAEDSTEWQPGVCSLVKLQLQYRRWLRKDEIDTVTPLFVGVAWSWGKLPFLQRQFIVRLGEDNPLQLVGMAYCNTTFTCLWGHHTPHLDHHEMLYIGSITSAINRSIGFTSGYSEFPFSCLGRQYYSSFFRRLRAFHHHPTSLPQHSYNVLPFFEHLEELDVSNFHFEPCPPTTSLPLCRTLRVLLARGTSLDWLEKRIFERVNECRIAVYDHEDVPRLSRVEMLACRQMEFVGSKYLHILGSFHLPVLDLLHLGLSQRKGSLVESWPVQDIVLPIQSIRPRVLQICMDYRGESLVSTLQSNIGMEGVEVKSCQVCQVVDGE
jgi:hypothetical protein